MTLLESAQALQPRLAELRREFHAHPEVSGQEEQTAARVLKELEKIGGYEIRTGISGHGILAELKGALPGPMVALRAVWMPCRLRRRRIFLMLRRTRE